MKFFNSEAAISQTLGVTFHFRNVKFSGKMAARQEGPQGRGPAT
jgi:hypothetical protein